MFVPCSLTTDCYDDNETRIYFCYLPHAYKEFKSKDDCTRETLEKGSILILYSLNNEGLWLYDVMQSLKEEKMFIMGQACQCPILLLGVWKTTQKHKTDSQKILTKRVNIMIRFAVTGLRECRLSFNDWNQFVESILKRKTRSSHLDCHVHRCSRIDQIPYYLFHTNKICNFRTNKIYNLKFLPLVHQNKT